MTGTPKLWTWIAPIEWSWGCSPWGSSGPSCRQIAVASRRITLAGGIAVFASSITAWFTVTTAMVVRRFRQVRVRQVEPLPVRHREVERQPLVNR